MLQAYVGIVSQRGLEIFCPERPDTTRFLRRRLKRHPGQLAGFWSVVAEQFAAEVVEILDQGYARQAYERLRTQARDFGFLLPIDDEGPDIVTSRSLT